jgi:monoamine oxidase
LLVEPSGEVDVLVVGAGAAGIAAARASLANGLSVAVVEARPRVGGRAVTVALGGHPVDLGAHWLHAGDLNPLVRLGRSRREPLRRAPGTGQVVVGGRVGTRQDRIEHGRAFDRADLAFSGAARGEHDASLAAVMPPLGRWRGAIEATMALISGRPLPEVSVKDFPSDEFGNNYFIRGGYGSYLARLASGLPIRLDCPVTALDWSGVGVSAETRRGKLRARAAVVTVPTPLLQAGAVRFTPALPAETAEAIAGFLPGAYEHVVLNWPASPFRGADRLTKILTARANRGLLTCIDGAPMHYLELDYATVAGAGGRDRVARLARDFLIDSFGPAAIRPLRVLAVTDWLNDPWSLSAWAVVPPGRVAIRRELAQPVGDRIWFAGEAISQSLWGTVGGAWAEGERAVGEIAAKLDGRAR